MIQIQFIQAYYIIAQQNHTWSTNNFFWFYWLLYIFPLTFCIFLFQIFAGWSYKGESLLLFFHWNVNGQPHWQMFVKFHHSTFTDDHSRSWKQEIILFRKIKFHKDLHCCCCCLEHYSPIEEKLYYYILFDKCQERVLIFLVD